MFDYTAIGQAMKMTGRSFNHLNESEKEEYFKTMNILEPTNVADYYSYTSYMPMPMPMQMPMPYPGMAGAFNGQMRLDSRFDAMDNKIAGVETTMTTKFAETGIEIADIKANITDIVNSVKTLSKKCLTNETSIQKFKNSQYIINYSIWICLLITAVTNYDVVKNKVSENLLYSVLILMQIYVITLLSFK